GALPIFPLPGRAPHRAGGRDRRRGPARTLGDPHRGARPRHDPGRRAAAGRLLLALPGGGRRGRCPDGGFPPHLRRCVRVAARGRGTYSEAPPNLRRWFRGTAAHNTVCVDGLDQTPYTRTRPAGPVAQGRFLGRATASGRDTLAGEARSPSYDAVHSRRVTLLDGERWVIEDRLHAATPHRYDLRFHLAPDAQDAARVEGGTVSAPG